MWLTGLDPPLSSSLGSFTGSFGSSGHMAGRTLTFPRSLLRRFYIHRQTPKPTPRFHTQETKSGSRLTLGDKNWVLEDNFKGHCWVILFGYLTTLCHLFCLGFSLTLVQVTVPIRPLTLLDSAGSLFLVFSHHVLACHWLTHLSFYPHTCRYHVIHPCVFTTFCTQRLTKSLFPHRDSQLTPRHSA